MRGDIPPAALRVNAKAKAVRTHLQPEKKAKNPGKRSAYKARWQK